MNQLWKNSGFCKELFDDRISAGSRAEMIHAMREARRRGVRAQRAALGGLVVLLLLVIWNFWGSAPAKKEIVWASAATSPWKMRSQPFGFVVHTVASTNLPVDTSSAQDLAIVHSASDRAPIEITDEQLLNIFKGRPLVLIRDRGRAVLNFPDQEP